MFNPYVIIIGLFLIGGLATTVWGSMILATARRTRAWPRTMGVIEQPTSTPAAGDELPEIFFSYTVGGDHYRGKVGFPAGTAPSPELTAQYVRRFHPGTTVEVAYDPAQPGRATLEPGAQKGDWLVLALGVTATIAGILFILTGDGF